MIKNTFGKLSARSKGKVRGLRKLKQGSKLAKDAKRSGAKAISETIADDAERDYSFVSEKRVIHDVKRSFGFREFNAPDTLDDPNIDAGYARQLRERAKAFFETGLEIPSLSEVFYEMVEFNYLKKTYGTVSKNGADFLQAAEAFSNTASKNDARIAIFFPFLIAIVLVAIQLTSPLVLSSFTDELVYLGGGSSWLTYYLLGGATILSLLVYYLIYSITYTNAQRLTIAHFSAYVQVVSDFNTLQYNQLKVDFQNVENQRELSQEKDEIISLASDYGVALHWAMFESLLFQNTLRNILFRYRRDASWWKFIGGFIVFVVFGICSIAFAVLYGDQAVWPGIVALTIVFLLVLFVQQLLTRDIEERAERDLRFNNFRLFPNVNFLEHISDIAKTEKWKYILMRDRLGGGATG